MVAIGGEMRKDPKPKINPGRYAPPPDIAERMIACDKKRISPNPIVRFFQIFFGEGF